MQTSLVASSGLIKVVPGLMIWTIVCFLITLFVLKRYAFGPIQKMLDERRDRIQRSIEEAEHAREEARKLLEEHRALIGQARSQSEEILAEARKVAEPKRVAATKVTGKVLDDADHRRLIDDAVKDLDFSAFEEQEATR